MAMAAMIAVSALKMLGPRDTRLYKEGGNMEKVTAFAPADLDSKAKGSSSCMAVTMRGQEYLQDGMARMAVSSSGVKPPSGPTRNAQG